MKIHGVPIKNLKIVPESMMLDCASQFDDQTNNFQKCIETSMIYRKAGLTPIYLCTEGFKELFVTSREKLRKEYH